MVDKITREDFISIVQEYKGNLLETKDKVIFSANNRIKNYYQNGKVAEDKVVPCKIVFYKDTESLSGEEKTYRILGGFGSPPPITEDFLRKMLERYNFTKVGIKQLSFFEMI